MTIFYTTLSICLQCVFLQLLVASDLKSQSAKSVKQVYLEVEFEDVSLFDVFEQVENQTDFRFFFDKKDRFLRKKFNLEKETLTVESLLLALAKEAEVRFRQVNNNISVFDKGPEQIPPLEVSLQADVDISGKITDENGEGLPGASVVVKGSSKGTTSDIEGNYKLSIPEGTTIVVSFVGYTTQEIIVGTQSIVDVKMELDAEQLEEVVVVGYGTQKKSDLTGSVASVSSEQLDQVPVTSIGRALQGQAAGVRVVQTSGQPGEGVIIRIRGGNSISGGNSPLFVIDGFPVDNVGSDLNPTDIESIEILKDASATAIYGSRGANGVVLVTTKRGKKGEPTVSYDGFVSTQSIRTKLDLLNRDEFTQMLNELAVNNGGSPVYSASEISALPDNDWQDLVYNDAFMQSHQLSVSGGTDKSQYFGSANYVNQEGIIKNSGFNRLSLRFNINQKLGNKIDFASNVNFTRSTQDLATFRSADGGGGIPFATRSLSPITPVFDEDGNYTIFTGVPWGATNPIGIFNEVINTSLSSRLLANMKIDYEILDGLKLSVNVGLDNTDSKSDSYNSPATSLGAPGGSGSKDFGNNLSYLNENILTYTKTFNTDHAVNVLAGYTYQNFKSESLSGSNTLFPDPVLQNHSLQSGSGTMRTSTNLVESKLISYLGRVNYTFKNKYLFTFTGRYDGSSKFGADNKYAFFPSAAIGWKINEEAFFDIDAVSNLKIRASLGESGNQAISPYQTKSRITSSSAIIGGALQTGFRLGAFENNGLRWETTKQLDLGLDLGLLRDRITLTFDYYKKNTTDLLFNATIPPSSGFRSSVRNIGEIENNGFDFQVISRNVVGEGLNWTSTLNFSANRLRVVDLGLDGDGNTILRQDSPIAGGNWFPLLLNEAPFQLVGYVIEGVYDTDAEAVENGEPGKGAGDYRWQDTNGDGVVNAEDKVQLTNTNPKFTFGFDNNFEFKNFTLSVFMIGSVGNDAVDEFAKYNHSTTGAFNVYREVWEGRWTGPGSNSEFAKLGTNVWSGEPSSIWVQDASFIKFRDIKLAYNFPKELLEPLSITSLRLYVSAQNMITITNYQGYDPEAFWQRSAVIGWDRGVYPAVKSFTVGVKAKF